MSLSVSVSVSVSAYLSVCLSVCLSVSVFLFLVSAPRYSVCHCVGRVTDSPYIDEIKHSVCSTFVCLSFYVLIIAVCTLPLRDLKDNEISSIDDYTFVDACRLEFLYVQRVGVERRTITECMVVFAVGLSGTTH